VAVKWPMTAPGYHGPVPAATPTAAPLRLLPYGSVTAPRSAPVTSLAYLASTPVV